MTRDDSGDTDGSHENGLGTTGGDESVAAALEAGVALFNAGHVLAARDRWHSTRLASIDDAVTSADTESEDDRVRRGLAAVATAADHARDGHRTAVASCATRAITLLDGVDEGSREIDLEPVREWCRRLVGDPEATVTDPPPLRIDGVAVGFEDLDLAATLAAAPTLAAAVDAGSEETMSAAAALARRERGTGRTQVTELVFAYLRSPDARPQIAARLADHVERDRRERRDVSGLFE